MIFDCERVEARADDGALKAMGVRWVEARTAVEGCFDAVATGCYCTGAWAALMSLPLALFGRGWLLVTVAGVLLAGAGALLLRAGYRIGGRPRELTFWREGLCYAPEGLSPLRASIDRLSRAHTEIGSIEAEQIRKRDPDQEWPGYTHGVRIVYRSGAIVHVASRLEPDSAHQLAVSLTLALRELRTALARGAMGSRDQGSGTSRKERVID